MIRVPDAPTGRLPGARRHRVTTDLHDLALRRDAPDSAEPARTCRRPAADVGRAGVGLCREVQGTAEQACTCRRPAADVGRVGVALRRDGQATAEPACAYRRPTADAGRVGLALRRDVQGSAEPPRTHRRLSAHAGRVHLSLPLPLGRHEVTLVGLTPVADETPPWWDEWRLPAREGA
ncbi:hypothetical protein ABZ935_18000 [Streptomyces coeruleorubidus]|uniref:hypothetical protein n=1 Tax=Streptomyces coeruleorubidus TaxID=116188 RepID=UPI0033D295D2